ncbi:DUF5348 domain-containing protein [Aneurinibacillus aneurinilyticus]|jgi:hypothetical protein|uniref:DUF5348 domain-containing protein n=1 Tax=Aneurinibacillus aneurinilyticus TaxID=1391 RepID=UPI0023F0493C|nr:DUF5348 domain-containing protein [Aneurinibacillus aneurinilyticus]
MDNQKRLLEEVMADLYRILPTLNVVSKKLEDEMYPSEHLDADTQFMIRELRSLGYQHIDKLVSQLRYLQKEVYYEGLLYINGNGRYEVDGQELASGSVIEVWSERFDESAQWHIVRIEHSNLHGGYYAYQWPELKLEGLKARVRH